MTTHATDPDNNGRSMELSVEEALRRAAPLAPLDQTVIADLTADEDDAFWKALERA